MGNRKELSHEELNSIILDGEDLIGTPSEEVIISDAEESQKKAFESNVEQYKNTLSIFMREKSMITQELYNKIMHALRCGHGGKKTGVDVKFHSWCKAHFQITDNAGADILCSVKSGVRIAITENYF